MSIDAQRNEGQAGTVKQQLASAAVFSAIVGGSIYASRNPDQVAKLGQEAMKHLNTLYSAALPYAKEAYNYAVPAIGRFGNAVKDLFAQYMKPAKTPAITFEKK